MLTCCMVRQPAVLSRLALFLMQMDSKQLSGGARREAKPIVVGVDDEETQTCTVVGVVGPNKEVRLPSLSLASQTSWHA